MNYTKSCDLRLCCGLFEGCIVCGLYGMKIGLYEGCVICEMCCVGGYLGMLCYLSGSCL